MPHLTCISFLNKRIGIDISNSRSLQYIEIKTCCVKDGLHLFSTVTKHELGHRSICYRVNSVGHQADRLVKELIDSVKDRFNGTRLCCIKLLTFSPSIARLTRALMSFSAWVWSCKSSKWESFWIFNHGSSYQSSNICICDFLFLSASALNLS